MSKRAAGLSISCFIALTLLSLLSPAFLHGEEIFLDVPFYPQKAYQCGPAAMASVMSYWGRHDSPKTIAAEMFSETARGSLTLDMYLYATENGFEAKQGGASVEEIRHRVDSREPVIVLVDNGFWVVRIGHYLVVVGYSDDGFFVHDGYKGNTFISFGDFEKKWSRTGRWALIMHPKSVVGGHLSRASRSNEGSGK